MNLNDIVKIQDVNLDNKTVLVRVDYNVPLKDGKVDNPKRITATEKTVKYLLGKGCKVVLIAHLGRPKGKVAPEFSLAPVAPEVEKIMGVKVHFASDCVGAVAEEAVKNAKNGEIVLLENLRFHPEEEKNDKAFAAQLAKLGEFFVQEAFGTVHRAHASTSAITEFLPSAAGFLIQKEVEFLGGALENPARPFAAIIGGAKVSDKIMVLNNLLDKVDVLIVGGGMAYTFNAALGYNVSNSLLEENKEEEAKAIMAKAKEKGVKLLLPVDNIAAKEFAEGVPTVTTDSPNIPEGYMGLDIGPKTIKLFEEALSECKTIFWNGPVGVFEMPTYAKGSFAIAETLVKLTEKGAITIIGGGDSLNVLKKAKISSSKVSHASTGGGASMEFVEGKELPGLTALLKK
ncbi:phosphoglycerate kinase [Candidatus Proelusimicrobium excrementi]|uniref:phosphoglycerate kinase n=1 Tax=Candidatus Proelusimicrobium excrementi TaxID=3416222 RepID=UPI003C926A42|nr:phosphoglycerate kinase [Elusimicrobiaceae bacterium]